MQKTIEGLITNWRKFYSFLLLLTLTLAIVFFSVWLLFGQILSLLGYNKFVNKFDSNNFSVYFNTSKDETLEFIDLPAIQFWSQSKVELKPKSEIEIAASGLVSLNEDYLDDLKLLEKDTSLKNIFNKTETERYYRNKWFNPTGDTVVNFNSIDTINKCRNALFIRSEKKRLLVGDIGRGSLVGFLIAKDKMDYFDHLTKDLDEGLPKEIERTKFIDSLLVNYVNDRVHNKENKDVIGFKIGNKITLSCSSNSGAYGDGNGIKKYHVYIPKEFIGSNIYCMVNDAIITDSTEFDLSTINECKVDNNQSPIRDLHKKLYANYNRKPGFWYLDNAGSFNIIIKQHDK